MIVSFRLGASTAAVLFMAVVAKLSASLVTEFTVSQVPLIWTLVASWLKPPYLHLVINCIIITIFASSKLQKHVTSYYSEPNKFPEDDYYGNANVLVGVMQPHSPLKIKFEYEVSDEFDFNGKTYGSVPETNSPAFVKDVHVDDSNATGLFYSGKSTTEHANFEENNDNIMVKHLVNNMSKPPSSAKIVNQNTVKANPEGKKSVKASKPKRELDTLESTWNAITNRQPMSEHTAGCGNLQDQHKLIKSQIFKEQNSSHRIDNMSKRLARSRGPGKLRKDPSLSLEELNKRAEAFINRFKEDMRLQRKESLNRYVEKINRSTY